ncbi:sensor histidine kinase [Kitasatospora sp. NPDC004531]
MREILDSYEQLMARDGAEFSYGGVAVAQFLSRAAELIAEVVAEATRGEDPDRTVPAGPAGTLSGREVVHPAEVRRAATALHRAALPVLTRELADGEPELATTLALVLHRVITERAARDIDRYIASLLHRTNRAHLEQRQQAARDLHDRISHTVSIALQNLELHEVYALDNPQRARAKLEDGRSMLRDALSDIRQMSAELREMTGGGGLGAAMAEYLRDHVPATVKVEFTLAEAAPVPPEIGEQLYLVMREAVHNSVRHSCPSRLTVTLRVTDTLLTAQVRDDGCGFDTSVGPRRRGGMGLTSMRERVEMLGGSFRLRSAPGDGTTVEAWIPLLRNVL